MKRIGALAIAFISHVAFATPTKNECIDANTAGQSHRIEHRLVAARDDFTTCTSASCPDLVRTNCRDRLAEVKRAIPSVAAVVPSADGAFLTLDGASMPLDGSPVETDPGEHELTLNVPGNAPITRRITLAEGEKNHREVFPAIASHVTHAHPAPVITESRAVSPLRIAGIVTGAIGLVGVGVGAAFGIAGYGAWGSVKSECLEASTCDLSRALADRSRALDFATASDVAFVVGGVLVAAGVTMFFLGHTSIAVSRDSVALAIGGTF